MRRLRVSGLVRFAKSVRQELAGPVSPARLTYLRGEIDDTLKAIEQTAREERIPLQNMPLPSRKAYLFLKGLDLSAVTTQETLPASHLAPESVTFRGLQRYFDDLLSRIARTHDSSQRNGIYDEIVTSSRNIENAIKIKNALPEQIKKPSREMRGWLAYFSQRENFEEYCAAVRRAEPIFLEACPWPAAKSAAILVQFRPQQGLYRIRASSNAILVHLPTPMISFDEGLMQSVAQVAFKKGGDRRRVHEATGGQPYRRIASALEMLSGVVAQTRGIYHDLAASFHRVNAAYFQGSVSRPLLVWSRTFAARKFGHYDHANDTIMVNAVLDKRAVPEFTVDFIMYHELLHKQLGIVWKSDRMAAHTPEFVRREREFKPYEQAKAVLRGLATER
jgi:hypothetical protein